MGVPDKQIFPHATGAAAQTVEQHQEPQALVFYAGWFCPFVHRSWIALEEKGIPYQYKEVNPYKKEKHFLDINPKGLVPAIEYQGKALYESLIICEFFEEAYPSQTPHLLPADPFTRAYARIWMDYVAKSFLPPFFRLLRSQEVEKQDAAREEVYQALRTFAKEIKGPYFLGNEFSLVDIAIAPWIVRDHVITEHRKFKRADVSEVWDNYATLVAKRDSLVKTTSSKRNIEEVYGPYLRGEA